MCRQKGISPFCVAIKNREKRINTIIVACSGIFCDASGKSNNWFVIFSGKLSSLVLSILLYSSLDSKEQKNYGRQKQDNWKLQNIMFPIT